MADRNLDNWVSDRLYALLGEVPRLYLQHHGDPTARIHADQR